MEKQEIEKYIDEYIHGAIGDAATELTRDEGVIWQDLTEDQSKQILDAETSLARLVASFTL